MLKRLMEACTFQQAIRRLETYSIVITNDKNVSTTQIQVILPSGMQLGSAERRGWNLVVLYPPSVPTPVLIWNGSSIKSENSEQFVFSVRNPTDVFVYYFVIVQSYEGGESDVSRPWVQIVNPTNIAGIEFSAIAGFVIVVVLVLPFVERVAGRVVKKNVPP